MGVLWMIGDEDKDGDFDATTRSKEDGTICYGAA